MICKFRLVWLMHIRIKIVLVKFDDVIEFCVKLMKTTTVTFEMLKSAYGKCV
jgi:hypothetical protein